MTKKLRSGFTLIETIIVVVIILILSVVAIPKLKHLLVSNRLQEVSWQMVQDLRETREDAILYQQDLNIYFDFNNSPVQPVNASNKNNKRYLFETFQQNSLDIPPDHYIPGDSADSHFWERILKYNIVISNIASTTASSIDFSGKHYFVVVFRSGAGDSLRGGANIVTSMTGRNNDNPLSAIGSTPIVITLEDVPSGLKFYVTISGVGKVSMNGSPPS